MSEVFAENRSLIFFLYGLSFFVLGLAAAFESGRGRPLSLGRALPYLAGFGIVHAAAEWAEMFSGVTNPGLVMGAGSGLLVAKGVLLAASGVFLLLFGLRLLLGQARPFLRWAVPLGLMLLWVVVTLAHASRAGPMETWVLLGPLWARYLLIFPGSIVAAVGLFASRRPSPTMAKQELVMAALVGSIAFGVYALLAGLVVPSLSFFPASAINYASLLSALGLPVQVLRSIAALIITASLMVYLRAFQVHRDAEIAELEASRVEAHLRRAAAQQALRQEAGGQTEDGGLLYASTSKFGLTDDMRMALQRALERMVRGVPHLCGGALFLLQEGSSEGEGQLLQSGTVGLDWDEDEVAQLAVARFSSQNGRAASSMQVRDGGDGARRRSEVFLFSCSSSVEMAEASVKHGIILGLELGERLLGYLVIATKGPVEAVPRRLLRAVAEGITFAIANLQLREAAVHKVLLERADQARAELLSNVSHELRTPLSSIKAHVTALLRRHATSEYGVFREYLEVINEETDRMTGLVGDLLDMSRLEARALKVEKTPVHVGEVIQMACNAVRHMTDQHTVEAVASDDLPVILGDPPRLERAIRNLIENAIRYSPDGGRVEVQAYVDGPDVVVAVRDEGIGIEPRHHELVFERFFREDNEVTRRVDGTGLGLAICRGIVAAHSGRIWVEGDKGRGSTFSIALPWWREHANQAERP